MIITEISARYWTCVFCFHEYQSCDIFRFSVRAGSLISVALKQIARNRIIPCNYNKRNIWKS